MTHAPPQRIAVLIPNLNGGGAERVTANLIAALVQRGVQVDLPSDTAPPCVRLA